MITAYILVVLATKVTYMHSQTDITMQEFADMASCQSAAAIIQRMPRHERQTRFETACLPKQVQ